MCSLFSYMFQLQDQQPEKPHPNQYIPHPAAAALSTARTHRSAHKTDKHDTVHD